MESQTTSEAATRAGSDPENLCELSNTDKHKDKKNSDTTISGAGEGGPTPYHFSVFQPPIKNISPHKHITIKQVYDFIRDPQHNREVTDKLRTTTDKSEAKKFKTEKFWFATFSGTFTQRKAEGLIARSVYFCVDIDHIGRNAIEGARRTILSGYKPALMFTSPSGDGLKIVYRIDPGAGQHPQYFNALETYLRALGFDIDQGCKDIPRACFIPHDPEAYYNEAPDTLGGDFLAGNDPGEVIAVSLQMIREASEGEKHNVLLKAARLAGGMAAGGGISEEEAIRLLEGAISARDIDDFTSAQKTIRDGIEHGKNDPIDPPTSVKTAPSVPDLDISGLPCFLRDFIIDCSNTYGTHRDFWAGAVLAATSVAIGRSCRLRDKYKNSPVLWLCQVAPTGIGKSHTGKLAFAPLFERDEKAKREFDLEMNNFQNIEKLSKKERENQGIELPPIPIQKTITVSDITPEKLFKVLADNRRGVVICRDELRGWIEDIGRYNRSGEMQNCMSAWSEQNMRYDRMEKSEIIREPFLNVYGGLAPEILSILAKDGRSVDGFMHRLCFIFPDAVKKPHYSNTTADLLALEEYKKFINDILRFDGETEFTMSGQAKAAYVMFYDKNADMSNAAKNDYFRGIYAKLDIIVLRLALILHVSKCVCGEEEGEIISGETMEAAVRMTEYFRTTAIKVHAQIESGRNAEMSNKDIARELRTRGNSQQEIAKVLKVTPQAVSKIFKNDFTRLIG